MTCVRMLNINGHGDGESKGDESDYEEAVLKMLFCGYSEWK